MEQTRELTVWKQAGEIAGLEIDNFSRYAVKRALLSKRRTRVKHICDLLTPSPQKMDYFL